MVKKERANRMPKLTIICGLPGAGKTEYARKLGCLVIEPGDNACCIDGEFKYNRAQSMVGHKYFSRVVSSIMENIECDIAVAGVFCSVYPINVYKELAEDNNYDVEVVEIKTTPELAAKYSTKKVSLTDLQSMGKSWVPRQVDKIIDRTK